MHATTFLGCPLVLEMRIIVWTMPFPIMRHQTPMYKQREPHQGYVLHSCRRSQCYGSWSSWGNLHVALWSSRSFFVDDDQALHVSRGRRRVADVHSETRAVEAHGRLTDSTSGRFMVEQRHTALKTLSTGVGTCWKCTLQPRRSVAMRRETVPAG